MKINKKLRLILSLVIIAIAVFMWYSNKKDTTSSESEKQSKETASIIVFLSGIVILIPFFIERIPDTEEVLDSK